MILDSTFLFDLMADVPETFEKGVELVEESEMPWLPAPVLAEVYYGAMTARSDTTVNEVRNRLLGCPRIALDEESARTAGGPSPAPTIAPRGTPGSDGTTRTSRRRRSSSTARC